MGAALLKHNNSIEISGHLYLNRIKHIILIDDKVYLIFGRRPFILVSVSNGKSQSVQTANYFKEKSLSDCAVTPEKSLSCRMFGVLREGFFYKS